MMYNRLQNPPQRDTERTRDPFRLPDLVMPELPQREAVNALELNKLPDPVILEQPNWHIRETVYKGAGLDHSDHHIY